MDMNVHARILMDMKTSASQLKAKLGRYMAAARAGQEVLITDRGQPVARLVPVTPATAQAGAVRITPPDATAPRLGAVTFPKVRYTGPSTSALLRADRDRR